MQIIKCYNCENEISDTEIVCPYCDYPVSTTKKKIEEEKSALSGETVKIATGKDFESEKMAILSSIATENEESNSVQQTEDAETAARAQKEATFDMQSETLRRSLEERRAQREEARRKKKNRKSTMIIVIALIIVGAFVVIHLVNNLVSGLVGTTKKSINRKARKEKVVTSDAEIDIGFKFHSRTLTIDNQELIMDGFNGNDENKPWAEHSDSVVFLTIKNEVTIIGPYSFDDLTNLEHVTMADAVSQIGDSAFYGCSNLKEVTLKAESSNLKMIGSNAFTNCESLEKIKLGNKTLHIGDGAFSGCSKLGEVIIPDSVTEIGADAFFGCHNLVFVCNADSYAYEYAMENSIEVKILDEAEEEQDIHEPEAAPETQEPVAKPEKEKEKTPESTGTTEPSKTTGKDTEDSPAQTQPSQTKEEKMANLQRQLANAQTSEERDRILQEIDKVAME